MDAYSMLQAAAVLLGIAALGGVVMAAIRFSGKPRPPTVLAMLHGLLAATGLALLAYAALTVGVPRQAQIALGIFVLAALGGAFINLRFHRKQLPLPIPLILGHAAAAVTGYVFLILSLMAPRVV